MALGVVDADRNLLHRSTVATAGMDLDRLLVMLESELRAALEAQPGAEAIGLGIPCTIDRDRGYAISAVNLPIVDVPIRDLISERLGLPSFIDNDGNVAALAEQRFGAAAGVRNLVLLTIGTGIGGGLVLEGEIYRGTRGAGAELGHIVIDADGPPCQGKCPNRGCIEALASGTALGREGRLAAEANPDSALGRTLAAGESVDGWLVTNAAIAGDPASIEVVALIGRRLGVALASLANIFEPDTIVIGGGAAAAGELMFEPAREVLRSRALPPMNETPVVAAELGGDSGMIGAATMALEENVGERHEAPT